MHIILGLLGILGAAAFFLYRMNMAANAARELADAAGELSNLPRKMRFRKKAGRRGLDVIDDPREAAAALVYGAAACKGDPAPDNKRALAARLALLFEISDDDAAEVLARAAWHVGSLNDPLTTVNKLTDGLLADVGRDACMALRTIMVETVAEVDGPGVHAAGLYVDKFTHRAGLR
jgi:uncharacterized tellurite resistance protein B-like protein